jgi:hypothetical protein
MNGGRGSGRTTRQLLDVLEMMDGPQMVLYICPTSRSVDYTARLMFDLAHQKGIELQKMPNVFRFMRKETMAFVMFLALDQDPERYIRAMRTLSVVLDHECFDINPRRWMRWMDAADMIPINRRRPY